MKITRTSIVSGTTRTIELPVTEEQIKKYQEGCLIQNAFPNLSPSEREFIQTGMTEKEWEELFPPKHE
jgi:hypothetical protein